MKTKATRRRMILCFAHIINDYVLGYKIEYAFREMKHDLGFRPVYHQLEHLGLEHLRLNLWKCVIFRRLVCFLLFIC